MGELSKHAEAGPLHRVTVLDISDNNIGDDGIAHIATALQKSTTMMTKLDISTCNISDEGAESIARALAVNKLLQMLYYIDISDNGIACIATTLQTNSTLRTLFIRGDTTTDGGALSLAAALTANSSIEHLWLSWSSTNPDSTLKKIGECVRKSTLKKQHLEMIIPSGEAPVAEERAKEWLHCVEVGGKELVQSLEDSHLKELYLVFDYRIRLYFNKHQLEQSRQALKEEAATVNMARREKGLPCIFFRLLQNL